MPRVALQLYTVREDLHRDFAGTLRAVAAIGYPAVQLAGYGGLSAGDLKRLLRATGLAVAGSHVGLERLEEHLDDEIAYNLEIENRDLIVPYLPESRRQTLEDYRRVADLLNRLGARCQARGARLSYHNHAFEFQRFDGRPALDLLLEWTDPALVFFEPDVYWIARAGEDPVAYLRRYAGRCPLVHLKDMAPDGSFAEVGEGTLDFPAIFTAAEAGGTEWYVVEQDRCARPPLESVRLSLEHLRAWGRV